ncbi:UDP-N-acetylglucosamine 2-epimerase (non-hydrolyzing) [Candidatus Thorarchaeota archaeon]|nr:MAG: UDP-N-acetylglucosamine 2-epimerase (non-hydrolyzing) [Candidatus Thorarchaeota archaeon]
MAEPDIFVVIGTRPEIIKMAPIIHECRKRGTPHYVLHTGQHYSRKMSQEFFKDLDLAAPDKNLNIGSGSHSTQTAKALVGIEKELIQEKPDVVLVQGDTNAVLSAALAAVKLNIPVAHVEAGLRSYDVRMPEEHNRRLTDHASAYLFAPTENSKRILEDESVWGEIFVTGNTVIDTLESRIPIAQKRFSNSDMNLPDEFALLTLHRAENVDDKEILSGIIEGLLRLETPIIFPAHPRTISRLRAFDMLLKLEDSPKIRIIEPVGYLQFLYLMEEASFIITDSGGLQEEVTAPSLNKQAFVLRTSTERPEAVNSGHVMVVGIDKDVFPKRIKKGLDNPKKRRSCPYGDGTAAIKILDILEKKQK